jgi:pSer/pThr/pTyr-binding forkhead associated (FHA) protein
MKWSCGFQLRVRSGPSRGLTYVVDSPVLKMGRAIRPGERVPGWIKVNDDTVSRLHCELFWQDDRQCFRLLHRSTTNSTYVNGEVVEDVEVFDGDLIEVGATHIEVQKADLRWSKATTSSVEEWGNHPALVSVPVDMEEPEPTTPMQKIPGATVPVYRPSNRKLSIGPEVSFVLSTDDGTDYELNGNKIRLGSDTPPKLHGDREEDNEEKPKLVFDTQHVLPLEGISYYNLLLRYDEIVQHYKVTRLGANSLPVRVFRKQSGLIWQTELPEGVELSLMEEDRLQLGSLVLAYQKKAEESE